MRTIRRAHVPHFVLVLFLLTFVAGACSSDGRLSVPVPGATGPLLTVESRGGECMDGPCGSTVVIERDGTVHSAAKPPNDLGTLPADQLAALGAAITATDFAILKSHPFTGECPTAFDGQEFVFEFGAPNGTQRIATCEVEVDYGSPLFVAVGTAIGPFLPLPVID
jgi:hypothetical protein